MLTKTKPIDVKQTFSASPEVLWQAITRPELMRQWFFDNIPDFQAREGFYTEFNVSSGERNFLHQWKIVEVIPGKSIRYHWSYAEYSGESYVSFTVSSHKQGSMLTLSHQETVPFPTDIPEFKPESCRAGWEYFINQCLKAFLNAG